MQKSTRQPSSLNVNTPVTYEEADLDWRISIKYVRLVHFLYSRGNWPNESQHFRD